MPLAHTRRFGELAYDESSVLSFPGGLPGFDGCTRFAFVETPEFAPIVFLQSLDSAELCFLAAPVTAIDAAYEPAMTREDLERLALQQFSPMDVLFLALLCAPENGALTANLLAPVAVNVHTRVAVQAVRADFRYSHRHPIHPVAAQEEQPC